MDNLPDFTLGFAFMLCDFCGWLFLLRLFVHFVFSCCLESGWGYVSRVLIDFCSRV